MPPPEPRCRTSRMTWIAARQACNPVGSGEPLRTFRTNKANLPPPSKVPVMCCKRAVSPSERCTTPIPEELQDAYEEGYQMGKATYLSEHPDATEAELDAAGKAGAREYLAEYLRDADLWDDGS